MKKFLLSMAACLVAFGAFAQSSVFNNPSNRAYFGIRASYDLSIPGKLKYDNSEVKVLGSGSGVGLGLVYNLPLVANLYLEPGIDFYYNTESIEPEGMGNFAKAFEHRSMRKFGMRVPVQFGYHFDFTPNFNVALMTGPVLNVGFSNDYYVTTKAVAGRDVHIAGSAYDIDNGGFNRVDCAWRIGLGFNIAQDYYVGVSGDFGMCNMFKSETDATLHENAFHVTLGYNF